jgi:small-conductance mechanosensitive channel
MSERVGLEVFMGLRPFPGSGSFSAALLWLQDSGNIFQSIWHYLNHEFKIGKFSVSLTSFVMGIVVFLLATILSRLLRSFLQNRLSKGAHLDRGIQYTIVRLVHYVIVAVGVLYALKVAFDVDLTSVAVLFTALSVGIGFGLQYIAHDIASGFILLFERPVRIGDRITIDGEEGDVQSINLRATVVIKNDGIAVIVPNSRLVSQKLINWSYPDVRARIAVVVGVAHDSDVELVRSTLLKAAEGVDSLLDQPPPKVQFVKFNDNSLDFRLLVWTNRPRAHEQIRSDINFNIERLFREQMVKIATPTPPVVLGTQPDGFTVNPQPTGKL